MRGECGGMGEDVRGLRDTNRQLQNSHGDMRYNIGNGVAKEPVRMTHGHEQLPEGVVGAGWRRGKERKVGTTVIA